MEKDMAYEANQAAIREAVEAEVTITLEKKKAIPSGGRSRHPMRQPP